MYVGAEQIYYSLVAESEQTFGLKAVRRICVYLLLRVNGDVRSLVII